jgi:hypothetical protein
MGVVSTPKVFARHGDQDGKLSRRHSENRDEIRRTSTKRSGNMPQ